MSSQSLYLALPYLQYKRCAILWCLFMCNVSSNFIENCDRARMTYYCPAGFSAVSCVIPKELIKPHCLQHGGKLWQQHGAQQQNKLTNSTMHHFVRGMCTCVHISVTKWCIVRYFCDALWDGSSIWQPEENRFGISTLIARFMGPTWGPPGSCQPQMDPMLATWTLLSGDI